MGEDGRQVIQAVRYSHDAMIDVLIARPMVSQRELARHFGLTEGWISQILSSDAFKKRFAERRDALVDPMIVANLERLFEGLGRQSVAVIQENLEATRNAELALKALEIVRKGLALGVVGNTTNLQQTFVAVVPAKAESYEEWAESYRPTPPGAIFDVGGEAEEVVAEGQISQGVQDAVE